MTRFAATSRRMLEIGVVLALAAPAAGAILNWTNASGGSASTAGNWSPAQVPTAGDDLNFNLLSVYTVEFGAGVPQSRTHTYRRGVVTLNVTSPHTVGDGITVGALNGEIATAVLTTGTLFSNNAVIVGNAGGSSGTLTVNDDDADLILMTASGDLTVGNNGAGTLNITGGGLVHVADRLLAGANASSTANLTVSGFSVSPLASSTLLVDGTSLASAIGAGGNVTMSVASGGQVFFAGGVNVAQGFASTSSVTIGGAGLLGSRLSVGGDLGIGRNQAAGSSGGNGTVTVNNQGNLEVGVILNLGDDDGGTGTLRVTNGGAVTTGSLVVGPGGTLDMTGGALSIDGGQFAYQGSDGHFRLGGPDHPVFQLMGGATSVLHQISGGRVLTVGGRISQIDDLATLCVRDGSSLLLVPAEAVIGVSAGDAGTVHVTGAGARMRMDAEFQPDARYIVGQSGSGLLHAELGGEVRGGRVFLAQNAGSDGQILLTTDATALFRDVFVGGSNVSAGGSGGLFVRSGAVCAVTQTGTSVKVWPNGVLEVEQATLDCAGEALILGQAELAGGTISAERVTLQNTTMTAHGMIDAVFTFSSASSTLTLTGDLTVGDPLRIAGFQNFGQVNIGAHALTIRDFDIALLNNASLAGGQINADNGVQISSGSTLFGFGTVDANITNLGTIQGAGIGLTFKRFVNGVGQGFSGPTMRFLQGGSFIGSGTIAAPIVADGQAAFFATGPLTMGNAATPNGIRIDGGVHCNEFLVTLLDQDAAELGGEVTLNSGTLAAANGITLKSGGSLTGRGAVNGRFAGAEGSVVTATGTLTIGSAAPGPSPGFVTEGELHIGSHTVTLQSNSGVDLGSLTTLGLGRLICSGGLVLAGDDELLGDGVVQAPALQNGGVVSPGFDTGALNVTGDYTQTSAGTLVIEIADPGQSLYSRLIVGGHAVLDGVLDLRLIDGWVPTAGGEITVMTYASRSGDFAEIVMPPTPQRCASVHVTDTSVSVSFADFPADLDGDGVVGLSDLAAVLAHFGTSDALPQDGDLDGDGDVDLADLAEVLAAFGVTCF